MLLIVLVVPGTILPPEGLTTNLMVSILSIKFFASIGLSLSKYAHFTSPIRRYSDLVIHRALISAVGLGDDGLKDMDVDSMNRTAEKISESERRSMVAERDTNDRYLAHFLSERVGGEFYGSISGVSNFGIFVFEK